MTMCNYFRSKLNRVRNIFFVPKNICENCIDPHEQRINDSLSYFSSLKNRYQGKRGFVIGNGPSLCMTDLERLKNEISIASNKIYLAFPHVSWRPTLYTIADPLLWEKIKLEIPDEIGTIHIPNYINPEGVPAERFKTWRPLSAAGLSRELNTTFSGIEFSSDVCSGMFGSWTVTFENLQLAVHLGLSTIYILGCDHYYAEETNIEEDKPVVAGHVSNHFIENYRKPGELVNPAPVRLMDRGYTEARLFSEQSGVEIFNATRGGLLNKFKRVDFDSLFEN